MPWYKDAQTGQLQWVPSESEIPAGSTKISGGEPLVTGRLAQATQAPQDPLSASLAALKELRTANVGKNHPVELDTFIQNIERGMASGVDPNILTQSTQAALQAARDQWNNDIARATRGEIGTETAHGNLQEAFGKIEQNLALPLQAAQEKKDITSQADTQAQEREAMRKEMLAKIPGLRDRLGEDLLKQQNYAYSQISPQIEARLNAMGILQSGALPEAQTRAFKDLEMSRQGRLDDFSREATNNLELNLPYASLQTSQGDKQGALNAGMELSRAGISRMFQENDLSKAYGQQSELSRLALEEARRAREQANKTGMWQAGLGALGQMAGAGASVMKFSDARLKDNVNKIGQVGGLDIVQFRWNEIAKSMGANDDIQVGVLAQDVERLYPQAVINDGEYKKVDYSQLPADITNAIKRLS